MKVEIILEVDLYPHGKIPVGVTGKATFDKEGDYVYVKLDGKLSWLDYWENEVTFYVEADKQHPNFPVFKDHCREVK